MKYTNTIVRNGKTITLTDEEVENIYRYQEKRYRITDARHHVNNHILRHTNRTDDSWNLDVSTITDNDLLENSSEDDKTKFHKLLNLTDDDLEDISDRFQSKFDCNCEENLLWDLVIDEYLEQI